MNAKIITKEEQIDNLWYRVADRFGIPTVILGLLCIPGWILFQDMMTERIADREERSAFLQTQMEATAAQTAAIEKLSEAAGIERDFEEKVFHVHELQTELLGGIQKATEDTNERMKTAEDAMADVPSQREAELALLKEIRDGLTN